MRRVEQVIRPPAGVNLHALLASYHQTKSFRVFRPSPSKIVDDLTESYCVPKNHPIFLIANDTRVFSGSFTSRTARDLQNQMVVQLEMRRTTHLINGLV